MTPAPGVPRACGAGGAGVRELESVAPFTGSSLYPPPQENGTTSQYEGVASLYQNRASEGPRERERSVEEAGGAVPLHGVQEEGEGEGGGEGEGEGEEGNEAGPGPLQGGQWGRRRPTNWRAAFLRLCSGMTVSVAQGPAPTLPSLHTSCVVMFERTVRSVLVLNSTMFCTCVAQYHVL